MDSEFQSIEELLADDNNGNDDESAQSQLKKKQIEIEHKGIEKRTEEAATSMGAPYINLIGVPISGEALVKISEAESERLKAVCFLYTGTQIRLAAVEITQEVIEVLEKLKKELHSEGKIYLISPESFQSARALYKNLAKPRENLRGVTIDIEELNKYSEKFSSFKDLQKQISEADVSQVVSIMLAAAIKSRSSDIHIESEEKEIKMRFRVDGVLHNVARLDQDMRRKIVSRLKVLAHVKINIEDRPQDGRFSLYMSDSDEKKTNQDVSASGRRIDIRISFLPTAYGESVVMRILDSSHQSVSFEELGLMGRAYELLKREIDRPNGMIITTGPTGSGKTTTLYAILQKLNNQETKIITIEDPIEYQITGINQSQVSSEYTFAKGLRSIVRQDPDVLMVGEIRDLETAEIAIQAALTGHLVLSTIHTNDASGTIPRLLSMGVKPFLLSPSLNVMIGQRLVRLICKTCKEEIKLDENQKKRIAEIIDSMNETEKKEISLEKIQFYKGGGCEECQGLGYKGRIGIYEIMPMTAEIEKLIQAGQVSEFDVAGVAKSSGMTTMVQDGLLKAIKGLTTVEEVLRVAE
ncbi:MAG: GspE/PulE family protein [bacterium]|nr:GspE/PulE family protein [bacterium]